MSVSSNMIALCWNRSACLKSFSGLIEPKSPLFLGWQSCMSAVNDTAMKYAHDITPGPMQVIGPDESFYLPPRLCLVSFNSSGPMSRSYRRRASRRGKAMRKPTGFKQTVSQLTPRFSPEELCDVITLQEDPLVCLELFSWASQQHRFSHDVCTYHITIKKLGAAKLYEEMDTVVNQVLAVSHLGTQALYNSIIYFFTEARKLTRAVNVFNHMRNISKLDCRPSIRTYNILFAAFFEHGKEFLHQSRVYGDYKEPFQANGERWDRA